MPWAVPSARNFALLIGAAVVLAAPLAHAVDPAVAACLSGSERGAAQKRQGHFKLARAALAACMADACPVVVRQDCIATQGDVDRLEPSVVFAARDESGADLVEATVSVDGEVVTTRLDGKPFGLDPGTHQIVFTVGQRDKKVSLVVKASEKNKIVNAQFPAASRPEGALATPDPLTLPPPSDARRSSPPPKSHPSVVLPLVLVGLSGVALVTFAGLGISAKSNLSSLENDPCAQTKTCAVSDVDSIKKRFAVADVVLGVSVFSLAAAALVFFSQRSAD